MTAFPLLPTFIRPHSITPVTPVLSTAVPSLHDRVTLEACASACHDSKLPVAGIDAGNHCFCGTDAELQAAAAQHRKVDVAQCRPSNCTMTYGDGCACTGNPSEHCGAPGRLLAYSYNCTKK